MESRQFPHLLAVLVVPRVSQLFFECFTQRFNIAVFAEDERQHEPIISSAYLAICAMVSIECTLLPFRNIRCGPFLVMTFGRKSVGVVTKISCCYHAACGHVFRELSDGDAVHGDLRSRGHGRFDELEFRRNWQLAA